MKSGQLERAKGIEPQPRTGLDRVSPRRPRMASTQEGLQGAGKGRFRSEFSSGNDLGQPPLHLEPTSTGMQHKPAPSGDF